MYTQSLLIIPTFDQLKEKPKTTADAIWVVFVVCLIFSLYLIRGYANLKLANLKEEHKSELEEKKAQQLRLESSYNYLQKQNQELIDINNRLLNQIAIAKRIYDIDSDFFNKGEKDVVKESVTSSN